MKNLYESVLDSFDKVAADAEITVIRDFILSNYDTFESDIHIQKVGSKYIVDVDGEVVLVNNYLPELTVGFEFGEIRGSFCCSWSEIKTLKGAPKYCEEFLCEECINLTSLEYAPKKVDGDFSVLKCENLKSLKGCPRKIGGGFSCSQCHSLTSLEGAPKQIGKEFSCNDCAGLKSLKGCPSIIPGNFGCRKPHFSSLEGAPKHVKGEFYITGQSYGYKYTVGDIRKVCRVDRGIHTDSTSFYESVLDDFDTFSGNADKMATENVLMKLEEELKERKLVDIRKAANFHIEGNALCMNNDIYINREFMDIIKPYKDLFKFDELITDGIVNIDRDEELSSIFKKITCETLEFSVVHKVIDMDFHITNKYDRTNAITMRYGYLPYFKNCNIEVDGNDRIFYCTELPEFFNCKIKGIKEIVQYAANLFTSEKDVKRIASIFDTKHKMNVYLYGNTKTTTKTCIPRNIRAIVVGMKKWKYEHHPPLGTKYIHFKKDASIKDIIDISGFDGLETIRLKDNDAVFEFNNMATKHAQTLLGFSDNIAQPLTDVLPDGDWMLNIYWRL